MRKNSSFVLCWYNRLPTIVSFDSITHYSSFTIRYSGKLFPLYETNSVIHLNILENYFHTMRLVSISILLRFGILQSCFQIMSKTNSDLCLSFDKYISHHEKKFIFDSMLVQSITNHCFSRFNYPLFIIYDYRYSGKLFPLYENNSDKHNEAVYDFLKQTIHQNRYNLSTNMSE